MGPNFGIDMTELQSFMLFSFLFSDLDLNFPDFLFLFSLGLIFFLVAKLNTLPIQWAVGGCKGVWLCVVVCGGVWESVCGWLGYGCGTRLLGIITVVIKTLSTFSFRPPAARWAHPDPVACFSPAPLPPPATPAIWA